MITGELLIGQNAVRGAQGAIHGCNPATGEQLQPAFGLADEEQLQRACALADAAFDPFRDVSPQRRAAFLDAIAEGILGLGDSLLEQAHSETGLPRPRLEGERGRTVGQLRLFAEVLREGSWQGLRVDEAQPDRKPQARSDLRLRQIGLGPVVVFSASNFPLAFSVAGGDTASAFAAGCPVIVKAHPAHPGTSELVGRVIQAAVRQAGLPEGVFSLLFTDREQAIRLVIDRRVKAVGFTGSRSGGLALVQAANNRPEPIPVFAEMSSINPMFLLPHALANRAEAIGVGFVTSLTMGAGQFCTNPGIVLAVDGPDTERFMQAAGAALATQPGAVMLTPGIHAAYAHGVDRLEQSTGVSLLARGARTDALHTCRPMLFRTRAADFLATPGMQEEIFGAASLVILCQSVEEMRDAAEQLEGQLTATLHLDTGDADAARKLLPTLERKAGRILANGYPTGVEVCDAMVHGGPFPSTSDPRSSSVGTLAIQRFLRPVCYQDLPQDLLPAALRDDGLATSPRRVNGKLIVDENKVDTAIQVKAPMKTHFRD